MRTLEADEFGTSMIAYPPGSEEKFALVMTLEDTAHITFFITREMGHEIAADIIKMVGHDA